MREPGGPRSRPDHLHVDAERARRDRVRLHRDAPRRRPFSHRHGHGVRSARPRLDPGARAGRRVSLRGGRDRRVRMPRPVGPGLARDPLLRHAGRPRVPVHACARARGRHGSVPRAPRDVRRRAGLGALLRDGARARALGRALGCRVASTGSSRAATRRSTPCGWRRATGCGAPTSRPTTRPTRPGSASPSSSTRTSSSGARHWRQPPSPSADSPASRWPSRVRSRSARSRYGSTASSSAG